VKDGAVRAIQCFKSDVQDERWEGHARTLAVRWTIPSPRTLLLAIALVARGRSPFPRT
jgi:hypothetical protein